MRIGRSFLRIGVDWLHASVRKIFQKIRVLRVNQVMFEMMMFIYVLSLNKLDTLFPIDGA